MGNAIFFALHFTYISKKSRDKSLATGFRYIYLLNFLLNHQMTFPQNLLLQIHLH